LKDNHLPFFWWGKHIIIGFISFFFLLFGVDTLISAYRLNNPVEFIMFFFSSNLIILISVVGLLFALVHIYRRFRSTENQEKGEDGYS
jgi:hypothetical protein